MTTNPARSHHTRSDIQGLRGLAVGTVVLFHIWPQWMPGGYVGVDVFFVISGFLISSQLIRETRERQAISFLRFYRRRFLRLAPMAALVLLVSGVGALLFLPAATWDGNLKEIVASALYAENWRLAWMSVDYLGAEEAPTAVQHYWSLSVEEQFYLVWPLLFLLALRLKSAMSWNIEWMLNLLLVGVFVSSLIASIILSHTDPAPAYFYTHTRAWELALGGLLALHQHRITMPVHRLVGWLGVLAIAAASVLFSATTTFPGYMALIPTLGAFLVIASGSADGGQAVLTARWLKYVGDRSYSLYLWHWPAVVFFKSVFGNGVSLFDGLLLLVVMLGLSHLSKRWVEDVFRAPSEAAASKPRRSLFGAGLQEKVLTLVLSASGVAPLLFAGALLMAPLGGGTGPIDPRLYPGAAAIAENNAVPAAPPIPRLTEVKGDLPDVYARDCHLGFEQSEPVACRYGDPDADFDVVLVGDSHAAQWAPTLERIAEAQGWALSVHTKSSCPFTNGAAITQAGNDYPECSEWGRKVVELLTADPPDLIIVAQYARSLDSDRNEGRTMATETASLWTELMATGARVVAIEDTPRMPFEAAVCVERSPEDCAVPLAEARVDDPFAAAAAATGVPLIDMSDMICPDATCRAIVGNIIVWRDKHHLTATYARTLAPYLFNRLEPNLPRRLVVSPGGAASDLPPANAPDVK